ncbi:MAG TPA: hypothetical protein VFX50_12560, partial [Gemmatimonadales bacterium]|nr:hypothetical protein [Gemmatimonadales bacterium]
MIRFAAPLLLAALPVHAADFPTAGTLAQDEFRALSEDLGAALSYKGVTPATALGVLGFDVGIEVTETRMENSRAFALAGAGGRSRLVIPKLHIHKGIIAGLDVGAFVGGAPQIDAALFGADIRYTLLDDGLLSPAVGVRLSGTKAT